MSELQGLVLPEGLGELKNSTLVHRLKGKVVPELN
jgi:hypothetical protein